MNKYNLLQSDYVKTPEWCAIDMIKYFQPSGKILDPCRGENKVFYNNLCNLSLNPDWCEITENIDFFENKKNIIGLLGIRLIQFLINGLNIHIQLVKILFIFFLPSKFIMLSV